MPRAPFLRSFLRVELETKIATPFSLPGPLDATVGLWARSLVSSASGMGHSGAGDIDSGNAATATAPPRQSNKNDVYIVSAARTPLGSFQGGLSHATAPFLGATAIRAVLDRGRVPPSSVGEVFMGNVCSAGLGQAPARQAALGAGLPQSCDATAVNKVCSSGLKAVALGAAAIETGAHDVVVAGGMESMTNIPYYAPAVRRGARLGDATLVDGMLADGLVDAGAGIHMGECAEMCAEEYGISREEQDAHAIESVERARAATAAGHSAWEIVPVDIVSPRYTTTTTTMLSQDEAIAKMDPDKLRRLPPFFRPTGGTVTAGNASPITDGAAAVALASVAAIDRLNLPVLARVLGYADAAKAPVDFSTAPAAAVPLALARAGVTAAQVDYWEINEAFSVVDLVNRRLLHLDGERVNVLGGSVAVGHPIGASGARILVTLLNVLRIKGGRVGVAAVCNGGGGATAMVVEWLGGT